MAALVVVPTALAGGGLSAKQAAAEVKNGAAVPVEKTTCKRAKGKHNYRCEVVFVTPVSGYKCIDAKFFVKKGFVEIYTASVSRCKAA